MLLTTVDCLTIPHTQMKELNQFHADIKMRVQDIRDNHADWLCGLGCDGCCHRLAEILLLTSVEWDYLQQGLAKLASHQSSFMRSA